MYCVQCGVELDDSEKVCPLCGTRVYHPQIKRGKGTRLFPAAQQEQEEKVSVSGVLFLITALCVLVIAMALLVDFKTAGHIVWSGYAIGGLMVVYVCAVLPLWFHRPNPVIFVPCGFAAVAAYLLYICLETGGNWFLTLAFPTVGMVALLTTAVVALARYVHGGGLYSAGGALIVSGACLVVLEMLISITIDAPIRFVWSPYPAAALFLLGLLLIVLAICRPLREALRKRFFV